MASASAAASAVSRRPELAGELPEALKCQRCFQVLIEPKQTECCGVRVCKDCVDKIFKDKDSVPCPFKDAEDCEETLERSKVVTDRFASKNLLKLLVHCQYHEYGCQVTKKWSEIADHEKTCESLPYPCLYVTRGCPSNIAAVNFQQHISQCEFRPTLCEHCGQTTFMKELEAHWKVCPKYKVECPTCKERFDRQELPKHTKIGCMRKGSCAYFYCGCSYLSEDEAAMQSHMATNHTEHLKMLTKHCSTLKHDLAEEREQRLNLEAEVQKLQKNMSEIKQAKGQYDLARVHMQNLLVNAVRQNEFRSNVEQVLQQVTGRPLPFESLASEIGLHPAEPSSSPANSITPAERARDKSMNEQIDRQLNLLDVRVSEMALRFQVMETTSYDGTLLWKISEYRRRKQEAVSSRILSLYSQPFYTSRTGYKMCARVYLNGDGMGKGTHMSLFFVIMKGDFDALLTWPFQQKVTLMLLDQENGKNHIKDTFRPDTASTSFRRPQSEMNVASGCPLFVQHRTLDQDTTYIKDDTLFIKITVDKEPTRAF